MPYHSGWEREIKPKAIEPLQRFLNEGMQDRKITDLFGPKQYVHIYTYVPSCPRPGGCVRSCLSGVV